MRSFASYICLLGLFSFGFFFVESAEGHGNRMDEPVVVTSESKTCRTPSTTVINQNVKGKYVVQQQFEGDPGVPRKRNEHWHYWSTSFTAYPGDEGYSSSCDTEREYCWDELSERLKDYCIANNSLEESSCDASNSPYTRKEKEYNVIYYYHDVLVRKCKTELILP